MKVKKITAIGMVFLLLLGITSLVASAEATCISELTLATGVNSTAQLESKGYTVLFQGMNVVSDEGSAVFLGYKMGGEAITDLRVSAAKAASVQVNGITYTLVSGISLNQGTAGTPLYLYATKDKQAGKGIAALETVTVAEAGDSLEGLFNDGSAPLLDTDGKPANLDKGIGGSALYLKLISLGCVKPYIAKACLVTGSTRNAALQKAAENGCYCFLDVDFNAAEGVTYLAYSRTAERAEAVTGLRIADAAPAGFTAAAGSVNGRKLYTATGGATPLLDVAGEPLFGDSFTLGSWAKMFLASVPPTAVQTVMAQEPAYGTLPKSTEACSQCAAGSVDGITLYAMYCGVVTAAAEDAAPVTEPTTVALVTETESEILPADETAMTDEYIEIDKAEETTAEEETTDAGATVSSVLGKGNKVAVILFVAVLLVGAVGTFTVVKHIRNKKKEEA